MVKYSEFHRSIKKNGWKFDHSEGSHYFYKKMASCQSRFLFMVRKKYMSH